MSEHSLRRGFSSGRECLKAPSRALCPTHFWSKVQKEEQHAGRQQCDRVWRMDGTLCAEASPPTYITLGYPSSIRSHTSFTPEERNNSAQRGIPTITPLESWEASRLFSPLLFPGWSPTVCYCSSCTTHADRTASMKHREATVVYPGRLVYPGVYREVYIPGISPGVYNPLSSHQPGCV